MKGLLIKDLYMIKKYCRMLILMIGVFLFISASSEGAIFSIYPVVLAGLIPSTLIAYEERAKWDVYSCVLPVTKAQTVIEKYIISIGGILAAVVLSCGAQTVKMIAGGGFSGHALLDFFVMIVTVALLGPVVVLPFTFGLGLEKGRIVYYISVGVICALAVTTASLELSLISISSIVVLLFDIIVVAVSAFISIKLYEKRELA